MAAARTQAWCAEIGFNLMWLDWLKDGSGTGSMREPQLMTCGWTGPIVSNREENVFSLRRGKRRKGQRRMHQLHPAQSGTVFFSAAPDLHTLAVSTVHHLYWALRSYLTLTGGKPAQQPNNNLSFCLSASVPLFPFAECLCLSFHLKVLMRWQSISKTSFQSCHCSPVENHLTSPGYPAAPCVHSCWHVWLHHHTQRWIQVFTAAWPTEKEQICS